jgi:hypothetical protein
LDPLLLVSERKVEFKLTGTIVPAGIGSTDRAFRGSAAGYDGFMACSALACP